MSVSLRAQPFFGEAPQPDLPPDPEPTPALFLPVRPVVPTPTPIPTPVPVATPVPQPPQLPPPQSSSFVPSDIPAPAIQSTGETLDVIPIPASTPRPVQRAVPVQAATPAPIPRRAPAPTYTTTTTTSRGSSTAAASVPSNAPISQAQLSNWVAEATDKRDSGQATRVGWAYFNRQEFSSAGVWFNQALEWNPQNSDASYGLALSKFREGDLSSAEAIANYRGNGSPKMNTLQGDIYSRRGTEAYEAKQYSQSLEFFNKASSRRPLSRNEQIIVAWDLYYTKQYEKSANMFERLYRASPDNVSAQGLYAALSKSGDYERLDRIARETKGPLGDVYMTYDARRYYEANLFIAAADSGGAKSIPVLQNLTTPSVAVGLGYRSKSGTEGEGQLQAVTIPAIQAQFFPANKFMLSGYLGHLNLNSGDLPDGAQVGNVPTTFTPYTYDANTNESDLWEFAVRLEYQDWISWYITLGTTPLNGPLQSAPIGNAGIIYRFAQGYVQGEVYSKSIKESITSWVGSVDPYTGQKWGRVTETGASASIFRSLGEDFAFYAKGSYGSIDGTNVQDNTHISGVAALSRIFDVPGYEYVTLGFALSYEEFDNNQNHFTYGNGGYFSPQYLVQGLIQAQFLTEEGKNWIAGGSAGVGIQNNKQSSSPYFPLNDDGQEYGSSESTTGIGLIQMQGAYLIDPNWLIGGSFNYAVTADYNEGGIYIWGRYFFEKRNGLLRSDMLGFDSYIP